MAKIDHFRGHSRDRDWFGYMPLSNYIYVSCTVSVEAKGDGMRCEI